MRGAEITPSCAESIFRKLTRHVTGDANVRSGYQERSNQGNEEWKLDRIIDLDEWPKFDQRGRSAILDGEEGQGPRSGKFSRTHVVRVAPGAPPLLIFFSYRFLYTSSFFGALGFFSYPLAGHLPLRKGRPRCRICEEGLGQKRGRRMRTRWDGRREMIHVRAEDTLGRKEDEWRTERRSREPIIRG